MKNLTIPPKAHALQSPSCYHSAATMWSAPSHRWIPTRSHQIASVQSGVSNVQKSITKASLTTTATSNECRSAITFITFHWTHWEWEGTFLLMAALTISRIEKEHFNVNGRGGVSLPNPNGAGSTDLVFSSFQFSCCRILDELDPFMYVLGFYIYISSA